MESETRLMATKVARITKRRLGTIALRGLAVHERYGLPAQPFRCQNGRMP